MSDAVQRARRARGRVDDAQRGPPGAAHGGSGAAPAAGAGPEPRRGGAPQAGSVQHERGVRTYRIDYTGPHTRGRRSVVVLVRGHHPNIDRVLADAADPTSGGGIPSPVEWLDPAELVERYPARGGRRG